MLALSFMLTVACVQGNTQVQVISSDEFQKKMTTTQDKQVVDVRTSEEYNSGHLNGALLIDFYKKDFKANLSKLDKTKPVFVYCAAGVRSGSAAEVLAEMGFKQIYDLKGGMNAWARSGKPVVK